MNDSIGNIYILGAGGKMGDRITNSLIRSGITPAQYEISDSGIEIIHEKGLDITPPEQAMPQADVAIFALPDRLLGKLTAEYVPLAKPGSLIILLDPAVVFAREAYLRNDCTTAVMHPCHPQLFFEQPNEEARNDHFGGIAGLQDIVISFVNGERKLFDEVAPAYADKNGGYTQIYKLGPRRGDAAEMALIKLIDTEAKAEEKNA